MDDARIDHLLSSLPPDPGPPPLDDPEPLDLDALRRLRAGELSETEAAAVEARLIRDPAARTALRILAAPPPAALADWAAHHGPLTSQPARIPRWAWTGGLGLALAAALVAFLLRPEALAPPAYRLGQLSGDAQTVRSGAEATRIYLPRSKITLVLLPEGEPDGPPPAVRVFTAAPEAPLTASPTFSVHEQRGALRLQADAGTVFGATPGPRTLYVGLAADPARLAPAEGAAAADARALPGVRWIEIQVDYRLVDP